MKYMLLRDRNTKRPVSYSSVPVHDSFAELIRVFGDPSRCEVRIWECDGTREALHAGFKTNEGWRDAKI